MSRSTTFLLLAAVLLFAFTATAMASMSQISCNKICNMVKDEARREKCLSRCADLPKIRLPVIRPLSMDEETVAPVKKSRRRRFGRRVNRFFRKHKCTVCKKLCERVKNEEKQAKCFAVCEKLCSKKRRNEEAEVQSEAAFRIRSRRLRRLGRIARRGWQYYRGARAIGLLEDDAAPKKRRGFFGKRKRSGRKGKKFNKCHVCHKFCARVKDEEKQAKCKAACKRLCSKKPRSLRQEEAEVQSEAAFRIRSRRLRRIGRIARRAWTIYRGARAIGVLEDDAAPKKRRGLFGKRRRSGRKGKKFPKCRLCFKFCSRVKDEEKRAKCFAFCKSKCSKKRPDEEAEVQSEAALRIRSRRLRRIGRIARRAWRIYRGARAIGLLEDDATPKKRRKLMKFGRKGKKFHKCRVCHKFCARVKDEEKQAKCKAACKRLCSKRRKPKRKSKKVEETLSAKPAWKCPACRLACEMIKNEKKKALCLAACDITACKDE